MKSARRPETIRIRFPIILRAVGLLAVILAILGLVLGLYSLLAVPRMDPSVFTNRKKEIDERIQKSLEALPEETRPDASPFDPSVMPRIVSSAAFHAFFYTMTALGLVFNGVLLLAGARLFRVRADWVGPFVALMLAYAVYWHALPLLSRVTGRRPLITPSPEWTLSLGAAWGVGNFGLFPMVLTYFWLWGPILVLLGRAMRTKPSQEAVAEADAHA
jgi:hypothetical protein